MSDATPSPEPDDDVRFMAGLEFQPWTHSDGEWTPPSNEQWAELANPHLVSVRLGWLTLHKSKPELVTIADQLGDEGLMELVADIGRSADWFKGLHEILLGAECRLMCGLAVQTLRDEAAGEAAGPK